MQVGISLKMFLLQRQKHFGGRRLFPAIISAAFNCFASEINRIRRSASLFLRAPFFTPLLCAGWRLRRLLSLSCKHARPRSRLWRPNNPAIARRSRAQINLALAPPPPVEVEGDRAASLYRLFQFSPGAVSRRRNAVGLASPWKPARAQITHPTPPARSG